jgi:GxxExxY protein
MDFDPESHAIIGAALAVHRVLGPGLLESAYQKCLALELTARGVPFVREVPIPLMYRGSNVEVAYRADFIVHERVLVEVKSVQKLEGIHKAQLLTYMRLTKIHIGLLLNFNVPTLKTGTIRLIL